MKLIKIQGTGTSVLNSHNYIWSFDGGTKSRETDAFQKLLTVAVSGNHYVDYDDSPIYTTDYTKVSEINAGDGDFTYYWEIKWVDNTKRVKFNPKNKEERLRLPPVGVWSSAGSTKSITPDPEYGGGYEYDFDLRVTITDDEEVDPSVRSLTSAVFHVYVNYDKK